MTDGDCYDDDVVGRVTSSYRESESLKALVNSLTSLLKELEV